MQYESVKIVTACAESYGWPCGCYGLYDVPRSPEWDSTRGSILTVETKFKEGPEVRGDLETKGECHVMAVRSQEPTRSQEAGLGPLGTHGPGDT